MNKHCTPLRYPGGKRKLSPFLIEILETNNLVGGHYVEPFAGGAGIAIELLLRGLVSHIHLNDVAPEIFSFWHSIVNEPEEFCRRVSRATLNIKEWKKQRDIVKHPKDYDRLTLGFAMFYLNRCNRSGILTGGVIGGLNQAGKWKMDARFSRVELIRRIEAIAAKKKFIRLRNWDAERFILEYLPKLPHDTLVYCDPPYFHKSKNLYRNNYLPCDHEKIAHIIQKNITHPWLVSYDSTPIIIAHYHKRKMFSYSLQYNAARVYKGSEVCVFSDKLNIPTSSTLGFIDDRLKDVSTGNLHVGSSL